MAFTPETKNAGDLVRSQDWNAAMDEIVRLENDKVDRAGDTIKGSLTVQGNVAVTGTVDGRDVSADGTKLDSHNHDGTNSQPIKHSFLNLDGGTNPHSTTAADVGALPASGGTVSGRTGFQVPKGGSNNAALMAVYGAFGAAFNPSSTMALGIWADEEAEYGLFVHHYGGGLNHALEVNYGKCYFSGGKEGFVTDRFINASGTTLRTGDVVKLRRTGPVRFHGDRNSIPTNKVTLADQENDSLVIGIVDTEAIPLYQSPDNRIDPEDPLSIVDGCEVMVVTLGAYAHCKVDATEAPIEVGDLLTSSNNPGHAKKAIDPKIGSIIGKALEPLAQGTGYIAVFVNIQ